MLKTKIYFIFIFHKHHNFYTFWTLGFLPLVRVTCEIFPKNMKFSPKIIWGTQKHKKSLKYPKTPCPWVVQRKTHVPISCHCCFAPQWQVSWLLNAIQAPDKQTVLLLFLSHTRNSTDSESKEFHVTYSAKASTYIFFHRTEIALTNPEHRSSHSGLLSRAVGVAAANQRSITSLIPFYEILIYPFTNLIQE